MRDRGAGVRALVQQAVPMVVSRAGLSVMGIADAVMVGRFGPADAASLALADGTIGRLLDLCTAFLLGGLVLVPRAFGSGDLAGADRIWRRSLRPALLLGALALAIACAAGPLLRLAGQPVSLTHQAWPVAIALGAGFPAALLAVCAAVYLEGLRRPLVVALAVLAANLLNIGLNWLLIGGHDGVPAFGALGSAFSTTIVRLVLAALLVAVAWRMGVGARAAGPPSDGTQWQLGSAALAIQAVMLVLVGTLTIFAGWLGPAELAALLALWTLNAPGMLIALGIADATAVQVASASGSRSGGTAVLGESPAGAALLGLALVLASVVPLAALALVFAGPVASVFTRDATVHGLVQTLVPLALCTLLADAVSFVAVGASRALLDLVIPTAIEVGTMALMVLMAAWLAFGQQLGLRGLLLATAATAVLRSLLLLARLLATRRQAAVCIA